VATARDGTYAPLSRPLFVYVKRSSFDDDENVRDFVEYMLENEQKIAEEARFVPLSDAQLAEQQSKLEDAAS
jgi:phosphate transport system substrate-binding protein